MACCIFAALVITNFLVFYRKIKSLLGFKVDEDSLWQAKPNKSPWPHQLKLLLPVLLVASTALYGTFHWHHISAWLNPGNCSTQHCDSHRH